MTTIQNVFTPIQKSLTLLYNKMAFSRPPIQKMPFLRPPYTTKCHFQDPPIQKNAIFETPLSNKMPFSRPHYTKKLPSSPPQSPFLNGIALIKVLIFVRTLLPDTWCLWSPFFKIFYLLSLPFNFIDTLICYLYKSLEYLPVRDKIYPLYFLQKGLSFAPKTCSDITIRT